MNYLSIGTSEICEKRFRSVQNSSLQGSIKPSGGLWFTRFDPNFSFYNEWVDFVLEHLHILFYKSTKENCFCWPCIMISLQSDAKIFYLCDFQSYQYLVSHYKFGRNRFSFEQLSHDYDGIYIDLFSLYHDERMEREILNLFTSFGVNTFILFQLVAIDSYQSGCVRIEPFDYEMDFYREEVSYCIDIDREKKKILTCTPLKKLL